MRKHSNSKFKKIIKSSLGMTYVELITALALLALIITAFTPMLLSSYETLYMAGEKTQDVYNSREEIEEGLARRDSVLNVNFNMDLEVNSDVAFENINVNGRKVISTFQSGLETVFGQIRARLEIISPSTVYDNKTEHDIVLQTYGLEYKRITFGKFSDYYDTTGNPAALNKLPDDAIHLEVIIPNKSKSQTVGGGTSADEDAEGTTDDTVYDDGATRAKIKYYKSKNECVDVPQGNRGLAVSNTTDSGRIKIKIVSPDQIQVGGDGSETDKPEQIKFDFTTSPLKVKVYYINTRGKLRTVSDYLYIDPPTIIAAGEAVGDLDYYTTAGVQEVDTSVDDEHRTSEFRLEVEGRKMRTSNSVYLKNSDSSHVEAKTPVGTPASRGVSIRTVRWIDNDEASGIQPYFVMAGSEGSIYRMYSFTSNSTELYKYAVGKTTTQGTDTFYISRFSGLQNYIDRIYNATTGKKIYPAMWSGDFSHIFEYTSSNDRVSYGPSVLNTSGDSSWVTSNSANLDNAKSGEIDDPIYNVFSPMVQFCYYYSGDGTDHDYPGKDFKSLSYILTERGWPLRLAGTIRGDDSKDLYAGYYALWDPSTQIYGSTSSRRAYDDATEIVAFHYPYPVLGGSNLNLTAMNDYTFSQVKLKSMGSYFADANMPVSDPNLNYLSSSDDYQESFNMVKLAPVVRYNESGYKGGFLGIGGSFHPHEDGLVVGGNYMGDDVEINDVIYIPSTDNKSGENFYIGTVHAYAHVTQTDKVLDYAAKQNESHSDKGFDGTEYEYDCDGKIKTDTVDSGEGGQGIAYWNEGGGTGSNKQNYPAGSVSDYLILSDQDGRSTYIAMNSGTNAWDFAENRVGSDVRQKVYDDFYNNYALKNVVPDNSTTITVNGASGTFYDGTNNVDNQSRFFLPEKDNQWSYLYLGDVYFTLGYSSNRERAYRYLIYDYEAKEKMVSEGSVSYAAELAKGTERLYWRSHYGQDLQTRNESSWDKNKGTSGFQYIDAYQGLFSGSSLAAHTLNKAKSNANGTMVSSAYLNSYNNDLYNVWFPAEMMNYTKVASKDGVTVAVGYNVAGSSYQYADADPSERYNIGSYHTTSTALGSIYNDGILAAMVEGQDDSLVNLLYFKDNATFDGTSLTDLNLAQYAEYNDYTTDTTDAYGNKLTYKGYGMHGRRSVDFTAVDIYVEGNKSDETSTAPTTLNYYAYYGDSHGRVFKSLVATGTGTSTDEGGSSSVKLVSFIKDLTYVGANVTNVTGQMEEITLNNGKSISSVFSEITTIDVKDELIMITGVPQSGALEKIVVGYKDADKGTWTWKAVTNCGFSESINDATIVGGYYYLVGERNNGKGFVAGVSIDTLKNAAMSAATEPTLHTMSTSDQSIGSKSTVKSDLLWVETPYPLYAIAGRDTN